MNTTGEKNTAFGNTALSSNTTGNNNTAFGYNASASIVTATNQTIIGFEATGQADNSVVLGNDDVTAVYMGEDSGAKVYAGEGSFTGEVTIGGNLTVSGTLVGAGNLVSVTESSNTGVRLSTAVAANHGDIGSNAVDLSYSNSTSTTYGATGHYSTAMGHSTTASGETSTAMGAQTTASGNYSTAIGYLTTTSGRSSTAMGVITTASDYASLSIGRYNSVNSTVTAGGSATSFDTDNAAFVIGNGTGSNAKSDAFVVYFNGNATLSGDLTINSDERLKENIQPLGSTLNKLNQIEGWTYSLKKDEEHTPKIGVLAQEVQAVFPELVTEGGDGILSVNYQGLVPVLINAINEQDAKIAALEAQNAEIKELKEMVRRLALKQSKTSSTEASN